MITIGPLTGLADQVVSEHTSCQPDTAYGRSKLATENAIPEILRKSQADWCFFPPPLLNGPGNMERLLKLLKVVNSSFFRQSCGWSPPFTVQEGLLRTVGNMP